MQSFTDTRLKTKHNENLMSTPANLGFIRGELNYRRDRQTDRQRERITTVQTIPDLKTLTPNFHPSWGFFKACPVGLTDS